MMPSTDTNPDLAGYEILLCVCGGIAAYKSAELVSRLVQRGAGVTVAMSPAARKFVTPLTFQALSGRRVLTSLWSAPEADVQHIAVTESADLIVVAPATADAIAKFAAGIADDLLSTLIVSAASPILLAPAMNARMWQNPITQRNLRTLAEQGFHFVGPTEGWLACRTVGPGRMADPSEVLATAADRLRAAKPKTRT